MKALLLAVAILMPPAKYDHPYSGTLMEATGTFYEVQRMCIQLNGGKPVSSLVFGCSAPGLKSCVIVLDSELSPSDFARLRRHEVAHCNGWVHK